MALPNTGLIGEKFALGKRLGGGSFGDIYIATDPDGNEVAVKLEFQNTKHPQLVYEAKLLRRLAGGVGVSPIHFEGKYGEYNVLIMDLMGGSLEDVFNICDRRIPLKNTFVLYIEDD